MGYVPFPAAFRRRGEVRAVQHDEPWTWITEHGDPMRALAGDWEICDGSGSAWSVASDDFARTYEQVEGDVYRRVGLVTARPGVEGEVIDSTEGATAVRDDTQWVVTDAAGKQWVVDGPRFEASYERCDAPS